MNEEIERLKKLDFAIEATMQKNERNGNLIQYKEQFIESFFRSGLKPNFFTRDYGARDSVADFTTSEVLAHMVKYANRAKLLSFEELHDAKLIKEYPFMDLLNGPTPLAFTMYSAENLHKMIEFFIYQRYGSGAYRKGKTDTEELFNSCEKAGREIDEAVGNVHLKK